MLAFLALPAMAEPIPVTALEKAADLLPVRASVGGLVFGGGSLSLESSSYERPQRFGGGIGAEVRVLGVVGLEVDLLRSTDAHFQPIATGETAPVAPLPAWQIPVLLGLHLPSGPLRPTIQLGAQLIVPTPAGSNTEPFTVWTAGMGVEFDLPIGPPIRVPIVYRASLDTAASRAVGASLLKLDAPPGDAPRTNGVITAGLFYAF